jgi:nitroreductase
LAREGDFMNTREAIEERRSIRRFKDAPIPRETMREILRAGTLAPSGKNSQPWRFVVLEASSRLEMIKIMEKKIALLKAEGDDLGSTENTTHSMAKASTTVFVFSDGPADRVAVQSIGAAIENMLLAALELGIGSLWICDVFYAKIELCDWLGERGELISAVSFGYPDEAPPPRPRKDLNDVIRWFSSP